MADKQGSIFEIKGVGSQRTFKREAMPSDVYVTAEKIYEKGGNAANVVTETAVKAGQEAKRHVSPNSGASSLFERNGQKALFDDLNAPGATEIASGKLKNALQQAKECSVVTKGTEAIKANPRLAQAGGGVLVVGAGAAITSNAKSRIAAKEARGETASVGDKLQKLTGRATEVAGAAVTVDAATGGHGLKAAAAGVTKLAGKLSR